MYIGYIPDRQLQIAATRSTVSVTVLAIHPTVSTRLLLYTRLLLTRRCYRVLLDLRLQVAATHVTTSIRVPGTPTVVNSTHCAINLQLLVQAKTK